MKVLITGVAGFLGTHLAEYYRNKDWDVLGIDNLTDFELSRAKFNVEKSRAHNLEFLQKIGIEFKRLDVRYVNHMDLGTVDFIIHCAAQPAMTVSIENPLYDLTNNVLGTANMLNIAKEMKVPFVNCSTIHVYGNNSNKFLEETNTRFISYDPPVNERKTILQGDITPLHVSKRSAELYTQSFAETYGLRTASFRLTGMYGERQFGGMDHGWVANFAIRTILDRPITVFSTSKQVRDILYAKDAARAFDMWFRKGKTGIYNIGGGKECSISLGECLTKLKEQTGKSQDIIMDGARFGDLHYFVSDYKKAHKDFKWKPEILPNEGLKKLTKWIEENKKLFQ